MNVTGCISYVDFQKRMCSQNKSFRKSDRLLTDIQPSGYKSEKMCILTNLSASPSFLLA